MKYSYYICYIDTDGIKTTCELDHNEIGPELGKMKDEGTFIESVFIAPKVYGGISINGEMVTKAKGLKDHISYWLLKTLLYNQNVKISQSKWYKNYSSATIEVIEQIYTLTATENKRELIRDSCGKIVGSKPYELAFGILLKSEPTILYYLSATIQLLALPFYSIKAIASPKEYKDNIIYLSEPLPKIIYIPPSLPNIIYAPGSYIKLLPSPKPLLLLCLPIQTPIIMFTNAPEPLLSLPAPLSRLCITASVPRLCLPVPIPRLSLPVPLSLISASISYPPPIKPLSLRKDDLNYIYNNLSGLSGGTPIHLKN
jgi:hypothetical protein